MLRPSVAFMPKGELERDRARSAEAIRKLYNSAEWRALRDKVRLRDCFTCQWPGCGQIGGKLAVDHRIPHRGDRHLFFDERNLWTLCKPHHDGAKQREDRARR